MKRHLISFADKRMTGALKRLRWQAEDMQFFDKIHLLTNQDLDSSFSTTYNHILNPRTRGFGYWLWKPYIIQQLLESIPMGDELYYVDAGCHFNPHGKARLKEYAAMLAASELGIVAFQLGKSCSERAYSKMDLMIHLGVHQAAHITDSGQLSATHVFCKKKESSIAFINEWLNTCYNLHFIDDSPSLNPNFPEFIEHRHDQSVFSILGKLHEASCLSGHETWPSHNQSWNSMKNYPLWDKRDLGWTSHLISRLIRKVKKELHHLLKN